MIVDWAENHKTFIVLNGGDDSSIQALCLKLWEFGEKLRLPFCSFVEPGCGNMMSCVGIIVPEEYFKVERRLDGYVYTMENGNEVLYAPGGTEHSFVDIIKSYPLAR